VFIQPDRHVILAPIKSADEPLTTGQELDAEFMEVLRRKGYENAKPVTSSEHLNRRIRATYTKV